MIRLLRRKPEVTLGPRCKHQTLQRACLATLWWVSTKASCFGKVEASDFCRTRVTDWISSFGREQARQTLSDEAGTKKGARQRCRIPNRRPQSYRNFIQDVHMLGCRSFLRGQEAAAWLSEVLGRRCRLLRRFAGCRRPWNRILTLKGGSGLVSASGFGCNRKSLEARTPSASGKPSLGVGVG